MSDILDKLDHALNEGTQAVKNNITDEGQEQYLQLRRHLDEFFSPIKDVIATELQSLVQRIESLENLEARVKKLETPMTNQTQATTMMDRLEKLLSQSATRAEPEMTDRMKALADANAISTLPKPPSVTGQHCSPLPRTLAVTRHCDLKPNLVIFRETNGYSTPEEQAALADALVSLLFNEVDGKVKYDDEARDAIVDELGQLDSKQFPGEQATQLESRVSELILKALTGSTDLRGRNRIALWHFLGSLGSKRVRDKDDKGNSCYEVYDETGTWQPV